MYEAGSLLGKDALGFGLGATGLVGSLDLGNPGNWQEREIAQEFISICITGVQPELVKGVRRGLLGVEPDGAGLCFAKFGAVGFGYQRQS